MKRMVKVAPKASHKAQTILVSQLRYAPQAASTIPQKFHPAQKHFPSHLSYKTPTMLTKNIFLEEIRRQYVYTARAKGLDEKRILYRHIFRNAAIPLITGFPAAFIGAFFTGSLLIETLFSLDGLGLLGKIKGETVKGKGWQCSVRPSGIRCANPNGHGFEINREKQRLF